MEKYVLSLDAGTTGCKAMLVNHEGKICASAKKDISQIMPNPGWLEYDPKEIFYATKHAISEVFNKISVTPEDIVGFGITNMRETCVIWDKASGEPVYNAIGWLCKRTSNIAEDMKAHGLENKIREKTGLVIDSYFSATKIKWIFDNVPGVKAKAETGELLFGTIDTWIIWNLTNGEVHVTDYSNASRTMLLNIHTLCWDDDLLKEFGIPKSMLPEVKSSSEVYGYIDPSHFGFPIAITATAGDQQAALFGQTCFTEGEVKSSYGTGCFLLMNTGEQPVESKHGLVTTIAWGMDGKVNYALEGSVFAAGSIIKWLKNDIGLIDSPEDSEYFANKVSDTHGIYMVPAFSGLGAPYWDQYARGILCGITQGVNKNHIIRAALECIAYQVWDIIDAMQADSEIDLRTLNVDGAAASNNFLLQFQADVLDKPVNRSATNQSRSLGIAYMAGLAVGFWKDQDEIIDLIKYDNVFIPQLGDDTRESLRAGWKKAIARSKGWEKDLD